MKLVELFLPCRDSTGADIEAEQFEYVESTLTDKFGGVTAYHRAPASGRWQPSSMDEIEHDEIVIVEVIVDQLDLNWWSEFRDKLLKRFQQKELLIRVTDVRLI